MGGKNLYIWHFFSRHPLYLCKIDLDCTVASTEDWQPPPPFPHTHTLSFNLISVSRTLWPSHRERKKRSMFTYHHRSMFAVKHHGNSPNEITPSIRSGALCMRNWSSRNSPQHLFSRAFWKFRWLPVADRSVGVQSVLNTWFERTVSSDRGDSMWDLSSSHIDWAAVCSN